jgi:hypothetical protein
MLTLSFGISFLNNLKFKFKFQKIVTVFLQGLLASESAALEVAELQKLVCKVFWSTTYMGIPPLLLQEAQFSGWMSCLLQAVQRPVPQVSCCPACR